MDANKDEAINCLKIAKNSINRTRALKFLNKARRLDPSIEIDEFLSLQPEAKNPNPNPDPDPDPNANANETTKEKPPFNPLPTSSEQEQVRVSKRKKAEQEQSYEQEQVSKRKKADQEQVQVSERKKAEQVVVIREIKRKKDYYDILGLGKNSSAEEIRKAYRKLSLKVHPDKNAAPGAEDSFKKLLMAFQCLSNEKSRRKYDLETSPIFRSSSNVCRRSSSSSSSSNVFRSSSSSNVSRIISEAIIHLIFTDDVFFLTMLYQPFTMEELMMVARSRAQRFKLTGSFRLKYEYGGKMIFLPKEDDLEADNELRTCIHRQASLGKNAIVILAEFI